MRKRSHSNRGLDAPGLLTLRRRAGLSQEELATRSGVSLSTVARLETGQRGRYESIDALARTLSQELGIEVTRNMLRTPPATDLKSLRERTGLSQEELAARANINVEVVRRLETEHASYFSDLDALAEALGHALGENVTRQMLLTPPALDATEG